MRNQILMHALGMAGVTASWALTEIGLASLTSAESRELAIALSVWSIAYLLGFLAGQAIARSPDRWRIPYFAAAALLLAIPAIEGHSVGPLLGLIAASIAMGLYSSASTRILFDTVPSEAWSSVLARLKLVGGIVYASAIAMVVVLERTGLLEDPHAVYTASAAAIVAAGLSVRRPAVPELALDQLDKSFDSLSFGIDSPELTRRVMVGLGMLFSLGVIARLLSLKQYQDVLNPVAIMIMYATFYSIGAILGARSPSPNGIALAGILVALLHSIVPTSTPGAVLELGSSLAYSGYAEAGLIMYVLRAAPAMLGVVTRVASITVLVSSLIVVGFLMWGADYDSVIGLLATIAMLTQFRRARWS